MTCGHNTIIPDGTAGKAREQKGARRNDGQGKRCEQEKRDAKRNAGWYRKQGNRRARVKTTARGRGANRKRGTRKETPVGTEVRTRDQRGAKRAPAGGKEIREAHKKELRQRQQEQRGADKNAGGGRGGRGERDTRSAQKGTTPEATGTGALIKTPVGEEVCVNGGCERRRHRERNCGRGKVVERKQTPAGGERCARTETAGKGTGKEGRE